MLQLLEYVKSSSAIHKDMASRENGITAGPPVFPLLIPSSLIKFNLLFCEFITHCRLFLLMSVIVYSTTQSLSRSTLHTPDSTSSIGIAL